MRRMVLIFFSAVLFGITLLTTSLYPQVKIKEKVEMNPGNKSMDLSKKDYGNKINSLPCDAGFTQSNNHYYQLVWGGYWGSLDPAQQLFNLQCGLMEGHNYFKYVLTWTFPYNIAIIEGQEFCRIEKKVLSDLCDNCWEWIDINKDSLREVPVFYLKGGYPDSLHIAHNDTTCNEIWMLNGVPHYEPSYYRIVYGYPNSSTANVTYQIVPGGMEDLPEEYIYLHTTIMWRDFYLVGEQSSDYDPTELEHGHVWELKIRPKTNQCVGSISPIDSSGFGESYEAGGWIPEDTRFNIEITEGEDYGELKYIDAYGINTGSSFYDLEEGQLYSVNFVPNWTVPDTAGTVKISVTPSEPRITPIDLTLRVVPNHSDDYQIRVRLEPPVISPGDTANILLEERINDSTYAAFPEDQTFSIVLTQGYDYGLLLSPDGTELNYSFDNYPAGFKFVANKPIDADSVATWIRVTTTLSTQQLSKSIKENYKEKNTTQKNNKNVLIVDEAASINKKNKAKEIKPELLGIIIGGGEEIFGFGKAIIKKPSIHVAFNPDTLSPGDTADVIVKLKKPDGTLLPFPPEQLFEVGVIGGCEYGKILASDGRDSLYFKDIQQPIRFIAADSIDTDSAAVQLRVGIPEEQGYSLAKRKSNAATVNSDDYCQVVNFQYDYYGVGEEKVKLPELEIIYPTEKSDDEKITAEPKMPEVICKARLKNYNKGQVTFEWEYWVSYEMKRWTINNDRLCSRFGKTKFKGKSYSYNEQITTWIVPFFKDSATFNFKAIRHSYNELPGYGCDKEINEWTEGNDVFTGGNVFVQVTAKDKKGKQIGYRQITANNLLGENQTDLNTIYNYASSNEIKAILLQESRTRQFNDYYWPIYGPPNGYGLMQLDWPAATEKQLWNWKANLDGGKNLYFNIKKPAAEKFLKKHGFTTEELLKCAFQKYNYNKHFYFKWNEILNKWEKRDDLPNDYGGDVYEKFSKL